MSVVMSKVMSGVMSVVMSVTDGLGSGGGERQTLGREEPATRVGRRNCHLLSSLGLRVWSLGFRVEDLDLRT